MIAFIRLAVFGFIGLSAVYFLVRLYARSVHRERLEKRFDAGGIPGRREDYVSQGMRAYEGSLRRRLLWLVYVVPMAIMAGTIYLVNHY
ncbi:MAG: hypothetical protein QM656_15840 [Paracoccaceae bacterium]